MRDAWLEEVLRAAVRAGMMAPQAAQQMAGLGDDTTANGDTSSWWQQLPTMFRDIYLSVTQLEAQRKLIDLNVERQKAGLPAIQMDLTQFQPGVQVGLQSDTKNLMLLLGGGAILAAVGVAAMRRR